MGILHGAEMTISYIAHSIFRLVQIVLALTVCGLYGVDLNKADKLHKYSDGKWVCLSLLPPFPLLVLVAMSARSAMLDLHSPPFADQKANLLSPSRSSPKSSPPSPPSSPSST